MTTVTRTVALSTYHGHTERVAGTVTLPRAEWEPETSGQIDRSETAPPNHIRRARHCRHRISDTFTKALRDELAAHRNTETRP